MFFSWNSKAPDIDFLFQMNLNQVIDIWQSTTNIKLNEEQKNTFKASPFVIGLTNHAEHELLTSAELIYKSGTLKLKKWFEMLGMPIAQWSGIQKGNGWLEAYVADRYYDHNDEQHNRDGTIGWYIRIVKYSRSATLEQRKWAAEQTGKWLGEFGSKHLKAKYDCVIGSPHSIAHDIDLSAQLAIGVANSLSIPIYSENLSRDQQVGSVKSVDKDKRWRTVADAYKWSRSPGVRAVLLVDDVVTTRSTVKAITSAIKAENPDVTVGVLVAARTADFFDHG